MKFEQNVLINGLKPCFMHTCFTNINVLLKKLQTHIQFQAPSIHENNPNELLVTLDYGDFKLHYMFFLTESEKGGKKICGIECVS